MPLFNESSVDGVLNGTTEVTIVPAPASNVNRIIKTIVIHNNDTSDAQLEVRFKNGVNTRIIWAGKLTTGDTWTFGEIGDVIVLDSTTKSITAVLLIAPTTNPDFVASYGDAS